MTGRAAWLAWGLCALCIVTEAAALLLLTAVAPADLPEQLVFVPAVVGFATIGALIAMRRPENPIGWLFCSAMLLTVAGLFGEQYLLYSVGHAGALPAAVLVGWLASWLGTAGWLAIWTFTLLLFPTGQPPSPRWLPVAWFAAGVQVIVVVVQAVTPGPLLDAVPNVHNPVGVAGAASLAAALHATTWGLILLIGVCAASVVARFRTARAVERQQLKWFVYAAVVAVVAVALDYLFSLVAESGSLLDIAGDALLGLALAAVPAAAGIAILRYHLYEIDVIINRTLVYALLTGALIAVYFGVVVILQQSFRALTGQESDLAIVAATLVIAALFNPLRRRIQATIDRRFFRRRYDAALVLAAHAATLRDQVDIDEVTAVLSGAVQGTLQPASVTVWVRDPGAAP